VIAESPALKDDAMLLDAFGLKAPANLSIVRFPRHFTLGPLRFLSSSYYYRNVLRWLNKTVSFDLAYVIHLKAADFLQKKVAALPVIFEAHELFADAYPETTKKFKLLSQQENRIYQASSGVVATSLYLWNAIRERYPQATKTFFISPNCVDPFYFSTPTDQADPRRLIYVGSFQPWKGVPTAIEAMRSLPEFQLTVVGGNETQVRELAEEAPPNVMFTGFLSKEQILPLLAKAAIGLLPNRLEPKNSLYTFPMKLVEYAAANKKVVATDLPVLRELNPGSWLQLIQPDNPVALAKAIREMTATETHASRAWAMRYQWDIRAQELAAFLNENVRKT